MRPPQLNENDPTFQDLILSVFQLSNLMTAAGDRLVADLGLTAARWQVLGALAVTPSRPVSWLARELGASRQNVQRIVNDLERAGFVTLQPNPHHKRAQLVAMTPEGERILAEAARRGKPWAEHSAAGIPESDVEAARRVLHAVGAAIQDYEPPSTEENSK